MSSGLKDKLYWRWTSPGVAHCFEKVGRGKKAFFESLCGRYERKTSGGQEALRPPSMFRCGLCDGHEMKMRGHEQSMPDSPNWRSARAWKQQR